MGESVSEIRELLRRAGEQELPERILQYEGDERSGVRTSVEAAKKRLEGYRRERERIRKLWMYEEKYREYQYICGIDEAGRGPLAGPVVAGAVILPKDCDILYVNDSKQLSAKKREELYWVITQKALAWGVGYATPERIDRINILQATYEAMREAVHSLQVKPDLLLNDAVRIPGLPMTQVPIVKGDAKSISIGAASIVAKVTRDRLMEAYDKVYPQYGFADNKGYGSAGHMEALKKYGPTPIHRRSFIGHFVKPEEKMP